MYSFSTLLLILAALVCTLHAEEDGHHDDEETHWEWAGLFKVSSSETTRHTFELRNTGEEDAATFRAGIFIAPCDGADDESFEAAEEVANESFESAEHDDSATHAEGSHVALNVSQVYELTYSSESWVTALTITFPSDGHYVMFTEHHPSELCGSEDYQSCFRDQTGAMVTILLEEESGDHEGHEDHDEEHHEEDNLSDGGRWLYTMLGCFLVWVIVFAGLFFLVCGAKKYSEFTKSYLHLMNMFASGAILSTVLFLILIEAYHFTNSVDSFEETQVAGVYGSAILAGFIFPTIIGLILFREDIKPNDIISERVVEMVEEVIESKVKPDEVQGQHQHVAVLSCDEEADLTDVASLEESKKEPVDQATAVMESAEEKNSSAARETMTPSHLNSVVLSIIYGDFLHNFCDGIFIGVAVKSCSLSLFWAILFATMFHEFAQEVSDFVILTNKVGLSIPRALALNAISGFSVVLGGMLTNIWDLSDLMIGIFLAFGSGNLIYLSAAELFPLLHTPPDGKAKLTKWDKFQGVLCFCLGAVVIGLTLLKHEHCDDHDHGGEEGGHEEH